MTCARAHQTWAHYTCMHGYCTSIINLTIVHMKPCEWRNRTFAHLNIAIECFHFWLVGKDARQKIDPKELQLNKNCYRYTQNTVSSTWHSHVCAFNDLLLQKGKRIRNFRYDTLTYNRVCIKFAYWSMKWLENFSNFFYRPIFRSNPSYGNTFFCSAVFMRGWLANV